MSQTLKMILKYWDTGQPFQGEKGAHDLPFDVESFCREMDTEIERLQREVVTVKRTYNELFDASSKDIKNYKKKIARLESMLDRLADPGASFPLEYTSKNGIPIVEAMRAYAASHRNKTDE